MWAWPNDKRLSRAESFIWLVAEVETRFKSQYGTGTKTEILINRTG